MDRRLGRRREDPRRGRDAIVDPREIDIGIDQSMCSPAVERGERVHTNLDIAAARPEVIANTMGQLEDHVGLPSHLFADDFEPLLQERWPDLDRAGTAILFYCYGPTCIRSRHCASVAARHGFRNLLWFRDGIEGWYAIGERLVRE